MEVEGEGDAREGFHGAMAYHGCVWRGVALDALDHAGVSYRMAYTCEHCASHEAAMFADLTISPFLLSLTRSPLRRIDVSLLPPLDDCQLNW